MYISIKFDTIQYYTIEYKKNKMNAMISITKKYTLSKYNIMKFITTDYTIIVSYFQFRYKLQIYTTS